MSYGIKRTRLRSSSASAPGSHQRHGCWPIPLVLAVSAGGCGAPPSEEHATSAHELESASPSPSCGASDLVQASCAGAWHYQEWSTCLIEGAVTESTCLDQPSCSTWQTCTDWGFGTAASATEVATFRHRIKTCRSRGCFNACEEEAEAIQAALSSVQDGVPEPFRGQVSVAAQDEYGISVEPYSPGFLEDDKYDVVRECSVTFQYPIPATGQGPVCGCEQSQCTSSACGTSGEQHSGTGLSLDALKEQAPYLADTPPPACDTCDTLAIGTPEEARAKFACLESQRSSSEPEHMAQIDARIRVLLTLAGDALTAAQRNSAWETFSSERRQSPLGCEPAMEEALSISPDADEGFTVCPANSLTALERDLVACERLAGVETGAVPASVAWVLGERCVGLLERVHDARTFAGPENTCVDVDFSQRARAGVAGVLRGSFQALVDRGSLGEPDGPAAEQYPELDRTVALIDRWYAAERASLSEGDPATLEANALAALEDMLDAFWGALQRARRVTLDLEALVANSSASDADVGLALALASARAARLDRDVLHAVHRVSGTMIPSVRSATVEILPDMTLQQSATSGDVLLRLTGDALVGLMRRLESSEPFHDLACRAAGCGPGALTAGFSSTPLSTLWRALAALDRSVDTAAGRETLADVLTQLPASAPWRAPLQAIAANQPALQAALGASSSAAAPSAPGLVSPDTTSPSALRLVAVMRAAGERARGYEATGLLTLQSPPRVAANVSAEGRRATLDALDQATAAFADEVGLLQAARRAAIAEALQGTSAERSRLAVQQRLQQLDTTLGRLNSDALGLSASLLALDRGLGKTADRVADIQGALDTGAFLRVGDTRRFVVRGHHGSSSVQAERQPGHISGFAASDVEPGSSGLTTIPVAANQQVLVEATGEYSPLCSLSRHGSSSERSYFEGFSALIPLIGDDDSELPLSLVPEPGTTIGPEGFQLVRQSSSARVQDRDEDFKDRGLVKGFLGVIDRTVGALVGGFLDEMDPVEDSSRASQSDSVSFHGGLRLRDTPFPALPAGALLLVELPRGETNTSRIQAVHLVQRPGTAFVVNTDADLYFVVNDHWVASDDDCQQLSPADDPHGVTVNVRAATPSTEVAARTIDALRLVTETIRTRRGEFLQQGRVLSTQLSLVRAEALLELESNAGVELATLPSVLRDLIDAYLAREIAAIDVAVGRRGLERAAQDTTLEAGTLLRDLELQRDSARLATLSTVWGLSSPGELRNGASERGLLQSVRGLVDSTTQTLLPLLELWHPDVLEVARDGSAFQQDALELASIVPETDPVTLVDEVERLISRLRNAYATDPIPHLPNPPEQPIVGVSFQRPAQWGTGCSGCTDSSSGFPQASEARSFAVWNAIEAALRRNEPVPEMPCASDADCSTLPGTRCQVTEPQPQCVRAPALVDFGIEPADVYRSSGGQATLSCRLATPVVQQWSLLFTNPSEDDGLELLSQSGRTLEARARSVQSFVTATGAFDVEMALPSALASGISLLYSRDEVAFQRFQRFANDGLLLGRDPVGLSAFSQLSVDFSPLAALRASSGNGISETEERRVSELILLMRVDARAFASNPPGHELEGVVGSCTPLF